MLDRTVPPPIYPFSFQSLPNENVEILRNGVTLHTLLGGDQNIGQFTILFQGGQYEEEFPGLSEILSRILNEGAGKFSGYEIADGFDFAGATFNGQALSHFTGMSTIVLGNRLSEVLPLMKAMITEPHLSNNSIDILKRTLKTRLKIERSKVLTKAFERFKEMIYGPNHIESVIQTEENIDAINRETLLRFYKRLVKLSKAHVYLSGGFGSSMLDEVKNFLNELEDVDTESSGYELNLVDARPLPPGIDRIKMKGAVQSAICCGMPGVNRTHEDFINLRLAVMALGGYFGSRLMSNIREEKGLTYHINAFLSALWNVSSVQIQAQCHADKMDIVVDEIRHELLQLKSNPPEGDELERLKMYAMTNLLENLDSPLKISAYRQLEVTMGVPSDYFEKQQKAINSLTADIISEIAHKYLSPDDLRIAIAEP